MPGASGYVLQVAEDQEFAGPLLVERTVPESAAAIPFSVLRPLWWRVRAVDAYGGPGQWSAARRFEILPPPLAAEVRAISMTPVGLPGGESASGLITLAEPAPPGGATVVLSATGRATLNMPHRVLIPAGASGASFTVETAPVTSETAVRISAESRGEPRVAALTIAPPRPSARLTSVAVHPAVLAAGSRAQGTVALSGPAPSPVTVRLAASDPERISIPRAVTIPAGATTASFSVQTVHGNTPGTVSINAYLGDTAREASLNLAGAASMNALPAPTPFAPLVNEEVWSDAAIEFVWSDVFGAATYTLEVDEDAAFATPLVRAVLVPRVAVGPLPAGTVWWRVHANDAHGAPGRWSSTRALRVTRR